MNTILLYKKRLAIAVLLMVFLLPKTNLLAQTDTKTLKVYAPQTGIITGASPDSIVLWRGSDSSVRKVTLSAFSSGLALGSSYWALNGNSGTSTSTNFIGTTDNQSLTFRTNNATKMTLTTTGTLNLNGGTFDGFAANIYVGSTNGNESTATGTSNVAFGFQNLYGLTSGIRNISFGIKSLNNVTSGGSNIGIGQQGGAGITTGSSNIAVGNISGSSISGGSNNILLGNVTDVLTSSVSNFLNVGNAIFGTGLTGTVSSPAGKIGIGATTPSAKLTIANNRSKTVPALSIDTLFSGTVNDSLVVYRQSDSTVRKIANTASNGIMAITTQTASYTAASTDYTIICKNTGTYSSFVLTLPAAAANTGKIYKVVVYNNDISVTPGSTSLLDLGGQSVTVLLGAQGWSYGNEGTGANVSIGGKYTIQSDGTNWYIIGN